MTNNLIILDIDQTLIDSLSINEYITLKKKGILKREPNIIDTGIDVAIWEKSSLKFFLNFLDKNFKYLGIWTNGTNFWLKYILKNVIMKYLPKERFSVLFSIDKSDKKIKTENGYKYITYVKDLRKVWVNKKFNFRNTLLIDDNFDNCYFNLYNSLPIKKYSAVTNQNNNFSTTIKILQNLKLSNDFNDTLRKVYLNLDDYNKLFS